jgi:hypothetical protein
MAAPTRPATSPAAQPDPADAKSKTSRWEALTNLSIGRRDDKEKLADIVHKGEIVTLTEEVAQGFLRRHRRPVIRPAADQNTPAPAIHAKDLFGPQPAAEQFGARPDPPGASTVTVTPDPGAHPADPRNAPEAHDPQTDLSVDPDAGKDK